MGKFSRPRIGCFLNFLSMRERKKNIFQNILCCYVFPACLSVPLLPFDLTVSTTYHCIVHTFSISFIHIYCKFSHRFINICRENSVYIQVLCEGVQRDVFKRVTYRILSNKPTESWTPCLLHVLDRILFSAEMRLCCLHTHVFTCSFEKHQLAVGMRHLSSKNKSDTLQIFQGRELCQNCFLYYKRKEFLGRFFYIRAKVYTRQNFLKAVVHVIITDQCNKPRVRQNPGNGYL